MGFENGSLKSGGFREDIITRKEDFANRVGGKFTERLRIDHDLHPRSRLRNNFVL